MEQPRAAIAAARPMEQAIIPERLVVRPFDDNLILELKNAGKQDKLHFTIGLLLFTFFSCFVIFWMMMLTAIAFGSVGYFITR
jgi:hypothetical protein